MKKTLLSTLALVFALSASAFAQAPAATSTSKDPIVQMHTEERAANAVYNAKVKELDAERSKKVNASVAEAVKAAEGTSKDPLVVRREAESKAKNATKADYDAKLKPLKAEHKSEMAAIRAKYKTSK